MRKEHLMRISTHANVMVNTKLMWESSRWNVVQINIIIRIKPQAWVKGFNAFWVNQGNWCNQPKLMLFIKEEIMTHFKALITSQIGPYRNPYKYQVAKEKRTSDATHYLSFYILSKSCPRSSVMLPIA